MKCLVTAIFCTIIGMATHAPEARGAPSVPITTVSMQEGSVTVAETVDPRAFDDGPYVFWRDASTAVIVCHCDGNVTKTVVENITQPIDVPTPCTNVPIIRLDPSPPQPPAATWPMPDRLLAVSDLEGNYQAFLQFLSANGVIDEDGHWAWGDGHLVFNGDIVDRGDQVTELLWLIRRLEHEARDAGGQVHFVLGNHETMVMGADLRYVHPKYQVTTEQLGFKYEQLYGPSTEIGRWLRTRNSVMRIGDLLFVHAGYSPELNDLALQLDPINERIRSGLGPPAWPTREDLATQLIWHQQGPLWYRGYFEKYADQWGGLPTDEQLVAILSRNDAAHIVVGHTVVEDVGWVDDGHRVIGIDVKWSKPGEGEGLLMENGELSRVDMDGKRLPIGSLKKPDAPTTLKAP